MLGELFSSYGQTYIDIATRYFIYGETPLSIAANINKSKNAVWSILRKIKVIVKNAGYSYFYWYGNCAKLQNWWNRINYF